MPRRPATPGIRWERLPLVRELPPARDWLLLEAGAGLSAATLDAYSRAVERYLAYCRERRINAGAATTEHVAAYLAELASTGLGRAARLQRLTALRLFYAYVVERGLRGNNPATAAVGAMGAPDSAAMRLLRAADGAPAAEQQGGAPLPWVPDEGEWLSVLEAARAERARTRLMLALAYDAALRREELCLGQISDVDPVRHILRVPAATLAGRYRRMERMAPISATVAECCTEYLLQRLQRDGEGTGRGVAEAGRQLGDAASAALFLSESPRNRAQPITVWTWSKVVQGLARRSDVERFTTQTPRHLRLTDLARAGRSAREIAQFAGYSRPVLALRYVRLAEEMPNPAGWDVERRRAQQVASVLHG